MIEGSFLPPSQARVIETLLAWYRGHARVLPWRALPGEAAPDPYRVWLSEVMLQQTGVKVVEGYYRRFLERWPTLKDLAQAPLEDVLSAWAGLGYYSRARNLHRCAREMLERFGQCPKTVSQWLSLPGVGPYTARAVCAIAFGAEGIAVDGNVERVLSRLYGVTTPHPRSRSDIRAYAEALEGIGPSSQVCQALMDLGATVCTPRKARCGDCPWNGMCLAQAQGAPERYPFKEPKKVRPTRYGVSFLLETMEGEILFRRREEKGLLGGMLELPSSPWGEDFPHEALAFAPVLNNWERIDACISHTFTHFHLKVELYRSRIAKVMAHPPPYLWIKREEVCDHAIPSLVKKMLHAGGPP